MNTRWRICELPGENGLGSPFYGLNACDVERTSKSVPGRLDLHARTYQQLRDARNTLSRREWLKAATVLSLAAVVPACAEAPPAAPAMKLTDFPIRVGKETLMGLLAEPQDAPLASDPALLLTFVSERREALTKHPYDAPARVFVAAGHRALSFDLPAHGERVAPGRKAGITGMCEALLRGDDPFARFVADGRAAVEACLERKLAKPGRIFACGVSRAGYCALRLAAAEPRIAGVAGLAPVTDWRAVQEFVAAKSRPEVTALALENFAARLAGRAVYLAIGNRDNRVGTECCVRFALRLFEEEARLKLDRSRVRLQVVDDSPGHGLDVRWRRAGGEFLVEQTQ